MCTGVCIIPRNLPISEKNTTLTPPFSLSLSVGVTPHPDLSIAWLLSSFYLAESSLGLVCPQCPHQSETLSDGEEVGSSGPPEYCN